MTPKWLHGKTIAVWDLECDLIPSTEVYCNSISIIKINEWGAPTIVAPAKVYTQYWTPYTNGSLMQSISIINQCDYYCGHNIIGYDVPMVRKLLGTDITSIPLDTLILAKIMFSTDDLMGMDPQLRVDKNLWGRYSLKAFGQRMGDHKLDFNDFSKLTKEMTIYCDQDVDLTVRFLIFLLAKENFPIEAVVKIEHEVAAIIEEQENFGFYIDIEMTRALNTKLLEEKGNLKRDLSSIFLPKFLKDGPAKSYKKLSKVKKYLPNLKYKPLLGTAK